MSGSGRFSVLFPVIRQPEAESFDPPGGNGGQTFTVCIGGLSVWWTDFAYHDSLGTIHNFPGTARDAETCPNPILQDANSLALDGSGLKLFFSGHDDGSTRTITEPSGLITVPPTQYTTGGASATDDNGNQISVNASRVFTDTLGTTALTITGSGTAASPLQYSYTAPNGSTVSYTMNFTNFNIKTNFACSGHLAIQRQQCAARDEHQSSRWVTLHIHVRAYPRKHWLLHRQAGLSNTADWRHYHLQLYGR